LKQKKGEKIGLASLGLAGGWDGGLGEYAQVGKSDFYPAFLRVQ